MLRIALLGFILLLTVPVLFGQVTHVLTVRDLADRPVPDVAVVIDNKVVAQTDQSGVVKIVNSCSPGIDLFYTLNKTGYRFMGMGFLGNLVGRIICINPNGGTYEVRATNAPNLALVNAANYRAGILPDMLGTLFGENLATAVATAQSLPLPTTLAARRVKIVEFPFEPNGQFPGTRIRRERFAQLLFVSPTQINFLIPEQLELDGWSVVLNESNQELGTFLFRQSGANPGFFSANANGRGAPAGVVLRVLADGTQQYESILRYNPDNARFESVPIDLGATTDRVFLILFGTGLRNGGAPKVMFDNSLALLIEPSYIGPQGSLPGVDQVNLLLPRELAGRGVINLQLRYPGGFDLSNSVSIVVK